MRSWAWIKAAISAFLLSLLFLVNASCVELDRRRAEVRLMKAEAKELEVCAWRQERGLECQLPASWPVAIWRAPDTKSLVTLFNPAFLPFVGMP